MVGLGYDIHQLAAGESLILGGVEFDSSLGTVAHSDGDVLLHALMDAILGACGLGDIGEHFPDTDPKYKGANSADLTRFVCKLIDSEGYKLINVDCTLILEKPKILPFKAQIRQNIAEYCSLPIERVNVKATTHEKIGCVGRMEGIAAMAVCQVELK